MSNRKGWSLQRKIMFLIGLCCLLELRLVLFPSITNPNNNEDPIIPISEFVTVMKNSTPSSYVKPRDSIANNDTFRHPNFHVDFPLCLVHVGKAAGSSVSCGLGLTYADCEGMPRDKLPKTHFFHMRRNTCPGKTTQTYVVTLRNPLHRWQSWFDFEKDIIPTRKMSKKQERQVRKRRGMLFVECYTNFTSLVSDGLRPLPNLTVSVSAPANMTCSERAWAAALGVRSFSYHEWFNYEHYWEGIQHHGFDPSGNKKSPVLLALRTEHLLEDWQTISNETLFRQVNRGAKKLPLSEEAQGQLCAALCPEIQIYKNFLHHARNLSPDQRRESIQEVQVLCPDETEETRECPHIPSFPRVWVPSRQYLTETKKRLFFIKE